MAATNPFSRIAKRTLAIIDLALLAAYGAYECTVIHADLIGEHMEMNAVEGWAFRVMTVAGYVSLGLIAWASVLLIRDRGDRKLALSLIAGVSALMVVMIGMYFYVHLTSWWLPFGVMHEGPEADGTHAVIYEAIAAAAMMGMAYASAPRRPQRSPGRHSTRAASLTTA